MAQFSIKDLADLARAGYTPAAVKEILTLSEKATPEQAEEQPAAVAETNPATTDAEPIGQTENATTPEEPEAEVDYKTLYEQTQKDLKAAQEANTRVDASGNEGDPLESVKAIFASYT